MKGIDSVDPVSESDKGGVIQVVGDATDDGVGRVRYPSGRENIVTAAPS